jgi:deoxyribonuclease V
MDVARERFRPDASLSTEEMEALQVDIAGAAVLEDTLEVTPADVRTGEALVAGVDQAFLDDRAVSAVVVCRGGTVLAREHAVTPLSIPYVPGLLAFREGEPIIAALERLDVEPDVLLVDGSGRIHYREAGLATHVGVCLDVPTVGVAKSLLCGTPSAPIDALQAGERVPIEADDEMTAPDGDVVGYAYQRRQYPDSTTVNPLYVSPGHRVSAETAVEIVAAAGGEYKLPRPIRLADRHADEVKVEHA